jgi:hypothetical protein
LGNYWGRVILPLGNWCPFHLKRKRVLREHFRYGWVFNNFLMNPRNKQDHNNWNCFVDQFKTFPLSIQKIILKKFHDNPTMWTLKDYTLNIYLSQLRNVRKWLPILVCLLTFTIMDQIIVDYHFISISDKIECEKMYINGLVERWMLKFLFLVETNYNDEILQKSLHIIYDYNLCKGYMNYICGLVHCFNHQYVKAS